MQSMSQQGRSDSAESRLNHCSDHTRSGQLDSDATPAEDEGHATRCAEHFDTHNLAQGGELHRCSELKQREQRYERARTPPSAIFANHFREETD